MSSGEGGSSRSRGGRNGVGQSMPKEIPEDKVPRDAGNGAKRSHLRANGRGLCSGPKMFKQELPKKDASDAPGQSIVTGVPSSTANGAGQSQLRSLPNEKGTFSGEKNISQSPQDTPNIIDQNGTKGLPKGTSNGMAQRILGEVATSNGAAQRILGEMHTSNGVAQRILGEMPTSNGAAQRIHGDMPTSNGAAQRILGEMPTSNGAAKRILGEMPTSNGAAQRILGEMATSNGAAQELIREKGMTNGTVQEVLRDKGISKVPAQGTLANTTRSLVNGTSGVRPHSARKPGDDHLVFLPSGTSLGHWVLALPAILATLCFVRSVFGEFVHDDVWAILNNPDSRAETPLSSIFGNDFWGKAMNDNTSHKSYRPLCVLSFRINVFLGGLNAIYFHAINIVLHAAVSSLLMFTCSTAVFEDKRLALAAALLFSAHPIHTEAVAGIVGRADVLSCLLFLLTFLSYIRSMDSGPPRHSFPPTSAPLFLLLSLILGTGAVLVKETGITVFGVCLTYDLLLLCPTRCKRYSSPDPRASIWYVAGPFLKRAALVSLYVALVLYFRLRIMGGSMPLFSEQDNPASFSPYPLTRFLTYLYLLAFNSWLLLAPITLCYDWQVGSIPLINSLWDVRNLATLLFVGIVGSLALHCLAFLKRAPRREVLVGLLFLVFPFIPASNLFFRVGFVVAERVLYMPSMGFCILCVHGLKVLQSHVGQRRSLSLTLCFLFLLLLFSCKSLSQSECWRSREALFRSGVQTLPHNAKVHYNYANFLKDQSRKDEAIMHYKTVLRLYPKHSSALNNLGTLTANTTEAEEYYRRALMISPQHSRALFNLGNLLRNKGQDDEAELLLRESLHYGSYFGDAYSSLGSLLADQKRYEEADDVYQTGIKSCPENSDLHNNYGVFLVDMEKSQKAESHYLHALHLRPDHHVAMLNLGRLYRSLGQNKEAEKWYRKALQISREADVISPLGALLYNTGQHEEARRLYQEAVGLHPRNIQIRLSLAQVLAVLGQIHEAEALAYGIAAEVPDCTECFRLLSAIYSKREDYVKALELIDFALQMKSNDAKLLSELHFTRGNQLRELNHLEEAFQSYERVAELNPTQAQAWMNMGGIRHMQGDYTSARAFYQKAAVLDPDSKLLKENLAKLQRIENRLQGTKAKDQIKDK
ncbi:protein O-mannosyl-transferase TMTC1 isoform X2 [Xenopus tropicalis]|uniref:dolichyl-phosphate-mannose--protein mannosyltransferase n=1 Tax=Xenopus tropicalis TaxID=8364 RepID=A0A8J1J9I7_XENTR|nr:protein O-mannosyl-transferase TMTC1 isoform X2 [Xenopus tropicalis]